MYFCEILYSSDFSGRIDSGTQFLKTARLCYANSVLLFPKIDTRK